tara:strand:- start:2841 stop:3371 length:531 start_codon:yes stop_codon:yes gene_type:complete
MKNIKITTKKNESNTDHNNISASEKGIKILSALGFAEFGEGGYEGALKDGDTDLAMIVNLGDKTQIGAWDDGVYVESTKLFGLGGTAGKNRKTPNQHGVWQVTAQVVLGWKYCKEKDTYQNIIISTVESGASGGPRVVIRTPTKQPLYDVNMRTASIRAIQIFLNSQVVSDWAEEV